MIDTLGGYDLDDVIILKFNKLSLKEKLAVYIIMCNISVAFDIDEVFNLDRKTCNQIYQNFIKSIRKTLNVKTPKTKAR